MEIVFDAADGMGSTASTRLLRCGIMIPGQIPAAVVSAVVSFLLIDGLVD
jgi:hypothetical protein